MERRILLQKLKDQLLNTWDIIVIGGGATGLGVALDAVTRGYKTLLLEQSDFAKGTSSRSTKLVHGGVRYLAKGDVFLVTEALHERGRILKNAPHITANQEFVIPIYSLFDAILYTVGLKFYDLLAGRLSLGKSRFINREKTLERLPLLNPEGLIGGVVYHDGQFDDSRMAITLARYIFRNGGLPINYFRVDDLLKSEDGKITGVKAKDLGSGDEYNLNARLVINATGVFADNILKMDDPKARPTIRPSQGVHIVLDSSFLRGTSALMIPKTDDGRVLFAIPWYGRVVAGTTDTPLNNISMEPKALEEEIDFILATAGRYLTRPPARKDVLCVFAGLRPLAADPDDPSSTKEVSRRHKIIFSDSGLLSVIGGKWTSYRRMAEETIDKGIREGIIEDRKCITKDFRLYSGDIISKQNGMNIYDDGGEIEKMTTDNPGLGEKLHPDLPYTRAEIVWLSRNEMPFTLEDMLTRRTRALFLDVRASIAIASEVVAIMAEELGHDKTWQSQQEAEYQKLTSIYL
jgi:glycerol-3-phosphate dehydrogenase